MMKKILLAGPLLTRSGYGEQSRFALRALRSRPDLFDIYIQPLKWGETSWMFESDEERTWIDQTIEKTIAHTTQGGTFDVSLQVTIPNEWTDKTAPINIGYTAGIETTKVAHQWLQAGNQMDHIIVVSNHSKNVYESTIYDVTYNETNEKSTYQLNGSIDVINYPVKTFDQKLDLDLDTTTEFNFLSIAQWGPRKNLDNTIKWFVEEFYNENVGFVVKTNLAKNCHMDYEIVKGRLEAMLKEYSFRKCKVYLLHGDMTDEEIHSLYLHNKIDAFLLLTHGEGFGLPLFEACYSGLPVVTVGWSGQTDFLYGADNESCFYDVGFDLSAIQEEVVWDGVLIKESMWAYAREQSAKAQMRKCYKDLTGEDSKKHLDRVRQHADYLSEQFSEEKMNKAFVEAISRNFINNENNETSVIVL